MSVDDLLPVLCGLSMNASDVIKKVPVEVVKEWRNEGFETRLKGQTLWLWVGIQPQMRYNAGRVVVSKQENAHIGCTFAAPPECLRRIYEKK